MPSAEPTSSPTASCETQGLVYHHNWDNTSAAQRPFADYTIAIDPATLAISFAVELEYLGLATARYAYGYGTTYVIDFEAFEALGDSIDHPGSCANRMAASFASHSFADYWGYSENPYLDARVCTSEEYLAYPPPSSYWSCSMSGAGPTAACSRILYSATFSWEELRACTDYEGAALNTIATDDDWINMTGRIYVEMVSPYSMPSDIGSYWVADVLQSVPFRVSISTAIHAIGSSGIRLFLISVIGASREFYGAGTDGAYALTVMTQTADYMVLHSVSILGVPDNTPSTPSYAWQMTPLYGTQCLNPTDEICFQYWELRADNLECLVSFGGTFSLRFNTSCNPGASVATECEDYLAAFGSQVAHNLDWSYSDNFFCNVSSDVLIVQLGGSVVFYSDDSFSQLQGSTLYVSGTGTIYVQVTAAIPDSMSSTLEVQLVNVWYCTVADEYEEQAGVIDQENAAQSGCFNTSIVDQGSLTSVLVDGESQGDFEARTISEALNEVVRFSFVAPEWLGRDTMFLHCEVQLVLIARRRRLADAQGDNVQDVLHFMDAFGLKQADGADTNTDTGTGGTDADADTDNENESEEESLSDAVLVVGAPVAGAAICLLVALVVFLVLRQRKRALSGEKDTANNQHQSRKRKRLHVGQVSNSAPEAAEDITVVYD